MLKSCSVCKQNKPVSEFNRCKKHASGYRYDCRECSTKQRAQWAQSVRLKDWREYKLREIKQKAKQRGLIVTITKEDIQQPDICPVFGFPLEYYRKTHGYNSPSIDRIDNTKGYIPGNVITVSWRANNIKADANISELEAVASFYKRLLEEE